MRKYELTNETKKVDGATLHRIRALVDIPACGVKAGDAGGWIEAEQNLSQVGNAWVFGKARVFGDAQISQNALVKVPSDVLVVGVIGSRDDTTTFYRGADGAIHVSCGCFSGTIDEFAAKVKEVHAGTKHEKTYLMAAELAKAQLEEGG